MYQKRVDLRPFSWIKRGNNLPNVCRSQKPSTFFMTARLIWNVATHMERQDESALLKNSLDLTSFSNLDSISAALFLVQIFVSSLIYLSKKWIPSKTVAWNWWCSLQGEERQSMKDYKATQLIPFFFHPTPQTCFSSSNQDGVESENEMTGLQDTRQPK